MPQSIENGFQIDVKVTHLPDYELQAPYKHFFSYQITIKNFGNQPAQLVSRFWKIIDGSHEPEYVNGLGVVGQQPILEPGETFTYTSACPIISAIGQMSGYYTFLNLMDQTTFKVHTPAFELVTTYSLN
jgi:ApaG protein